MNPLAKAMLVVTSLVAVAAVIALVATCGRLQELENKSAQVGLHHVRISCVDAVSGAALKPRLVNVPSSESDIVAENQPGAVSVYWAGMKSEGDMMGAGAAGYEVKLLRKNWHETAEVVLRLSRVETKDDEQAGAGHPATRSESDSEAGDEPQPESEGRSR